MSAQNERLNYLFFNYYNETATQLERDELFQIINSSADDAVLTVLIHEAWNNLHLDQSLFDSTKSVDMLNSIIQKKHHDDTFQKIRPPSPRQLWVKLSIAATLICFVGIGTYLLSGHKKQTQPITILTKTLPKHDIPPGGYRAQLILANGKTIYLDNARNGVLAKEGSTKINKTRDGQLVI